MIMEKKQEILLAAYECFLKYGYSKTSMKDIGQKVNLNKASLYYHFNDKLALYREVVNMIRNKYLQELELLLEKQKSAYDKILLFIHEEVSFSEKSSVILTTGNNNIADSKMETKEVYIEIIRADIIRIDKMLQEGINKNDLVACDTRKVATAIMTVADAVLNANCPLFVDDIDKEKVYSNIQEQLNFMIKLMLDGLKLK
jgi:AcrR family transcriptional regulator